MDAGVINNRIKVETEHTEQGVFWKEIIKKGLPYLMIAPTMAVSLVFLVYPILYMIKLGFYKWNMVGEMKFIGLDKLQSFDDGSGVPAGAEKHLSVLFLDGSRMYDSGNDVRSLSQ